MCVRNPDCSPVRIDRRDVAQNPTALLEIVSDDFPVLHANGGSFVLHTPTSQRQRRLSLFNHRVHVVTLTAKRAYQLRTMRQFRL